MNKPVLFLLITIGAITSVGATMITKPNSNIYPTTMKVIGMEENNDKLILQNATGFVYELYGIEDYFMGDYVSLLMNDNGTEIITDDVIVDHQYSGYHD